MKMHLKMERLTKKYWFKVFVRHKWYKGRYFGFNSEVDHCHSATFDYVRAS